MAYTLPSRPDRPYPALSLLSANGGETLPGLLDPVVEGKKRERAGAADLGGAIVREGSGSWSAGGRTPAVWSLAEVGVGSAW